MYEDYWQLECKPFEPATGWGSMFATPSRTSAQHKLRYTVENRRPAVLLAGEAGSGKSLLGQALLEQLGDAVGARAHLVYPLMSPREMLSLLADQLQGTGRESARETLPATVDESLQRIEAVVTENHQHNRLSVVVVDEAHLLEDAGLLDPLRLLLNLSRNHQPQFTLVLIGNLSALSMIERCNHLDERLEMSMMLKPFTAEETAGYIEHSLVHAGSTRPLFTAKALEIAHQLTGGNVRRINRLCDLALVVGFAAQETQVDADQLQSVHSELIAVSTAA